MAQFEAFIGVNFWTALLTLCNFLLVLYFGKKYLCGPIIKIIQDRQREVDDLYESAGSAKKQAEELRADCQQKLTAAQAASERIVKEAVARGQTREEEIIRKANSEAAAIMDKAASDIAMEKRKAINDAKNEISGLAMAIAGKVVQRELDEADQAKLIDLFLDGLGDSV